MKVLIPPDYVFAMRCLDRLNRAHNQLEGKNMSFSSFGPFKGQDYFLQVSKATNRLSPVLVLWSRTLRARTSRMKPRYKWIPNPFLSRLPLYCPVSIWPVAEIRVEAQSFHFGEV